jgi:outer membrane protein OmpA-like peptidoglycan-associated protein
MNKSLLVVFVCCFLPFALFAQTYPVSIRNTTRINTGALEFSPAYYGNGIVFVTSRKQGGMIDPKIGETFFELYYADLDLYGAPYRPEPFSVEINSFFHEGPVSFNRPGDKIYFTRNSQQRGATTADKSGRVSLKVYEAHRGLYDWERVREMPFNSNQYSCMHPSLSYDGSRMFFSSNMPGGFGKRDIYFVDWDGQKWSEPINLGPEVNTPNDEVFPYVHDNGTLFFSSQGHNSFGGMDVFMIDLSGINWGRVINVGEPINSRQDDFGFVIDPDGLKGFFSSNRNGGMGKDDIYGFDAPDGLKGMRPVANVALTLKVIDGENNAGLSQAAVRIFERSNDGLIKDGNTYSAKLLDDPNRPGEYIMQLDRKPEDDLGAPSILSERNGEAELGLASNKEYILLVSKDGYQTKEIPFIPRIQKGKAQLDVILPKRNCVNLRGLALTEKTDRPIPNAKVRIISSCGGKELLLQTDLDGSYNYCLEFGCVYTVYIEKMGFRTGQTQISTENVRGSRSFSSSVRLTPTGETAVRKPLAEGTVIVLENIYYDFNKASLRSGNARDLDALARLMLKYPTMEVELTAHTDARGAADYNLQLSQRRAEAAKEYITRQGVSASRIKTQGLGESAIRNHCKDGVDCSETEHQYNRRTEVKVTRINEPAAME